jgi:transposase
MALTETAQSCSPKLLTLSGRQSSGQRPGIVITSSSAGVSAASNRSAGQSVLETGKPIAQVARELGVHEGTLGNWVSRERRARDGGRATLNADERAELVRLRRGNAELQMQRDVLKRSVALWVTEAMGR